MVGLQVFLPAGRQGSRLLGFESLNINTNYNMNQGEYIVYILISEKKEHWSYVGSTSNIEQRFKDHQSGKTKSTKGYRPLKVIHTEKHSSREEAYKRELYLKSGIGREERYQIIKHSGIV